MEKYKILMLGTCLAFCSAVSAQEKQILPPPPLPVPQVPEVKVINPKELKNSVAMVHPKRLHKVIPPPPPPVPPLPTIPPPPPPKPSE